MVFHITVQWMRLGLDGKLGKDSSNGDAELYTARYDLPFRSETLQWAMECMLSTCQRFGTDCKDLIAVI